MTELPNGWRFSRLDEVATVVRGVTYSSKDVLGSQSAEAITLLRATNIQNGVLDQLDPVWIPRTLVKPQQVLAPGDVVIASSSGSIQVVGKSAMVKSPLDATFGAFCTTVRATTVLPAYLAFYLQDPSLRQKWSDLASGSNINNLKTTDIAATLIPVPPLEEQKGIVEALEYHLSRLDKALAELHEAEHEIELLIESYRHSVISGAYSQGVEGWRDARLGEIARWGSGGTPQSGNPKYYGGTIPWCVIGDLTESDVFFTEKNITDEGLEASSAKIVQPGTVLLAMYGASIGRTGLAATPMATNQAIAFAVPSPEIDPDYLLLFLQSQKRKFVNAGKGGAQPNISQTIIKDWEITFPPVDEQLRLIDQVKEHQQSIAVLREQNQSMQKQVLLLKKSLLNAAFTGALKVQEKQ